MFLYLDKKSLDSTVKKQLALLRKDTNTYPMNKPKRRGRPTSYAFANNRHQRNAWTLLFADRSPKRRHGTIIIIQTTGKRIK